MKLINFTFKSIIVHTFTYFVFGLVMSNFFDYEMLFQMDVIKNFMRGYDSPMIMFGPLLQPIRGILFALAIWPLREIIMNKNQGWLILWSTIILIGILSTPSAAPASVEGVIYSRLPLWYHLIGLPELLLQTGCFSFLVVMWGNNRLHKFITWIITILTVLIIGVLLLGIFMS